MKPMQRLTATSPNPLTRSLLQAGRGDTPSDPARRRATTAVVVAASLSAATTTTAGATGGVTGAAAAASKWAGSAVLLKWTTAAIATATLAGGAIAMGVPHEHEKAASAPSSPSVPTVVVARSAAPARPRAGLPEELAVPLPEASAAAARASLPAAAAGASGVPNLITPARTRVAPLASVAPPASSLDDAASLRRELALLDAARTSLAAGRAMNALAELDTYDRVFPNGSLADEARVLRIETLARAGLREAAAREAERLLARDPDSPHAARVRSVLARSSPAGEP
jgi:hypothetical protein